MPFPLNFKRHIRDSRDVETELRRCLTESDIRALRNDCRTLSRSDWLYWISLHDGLIAAFLALPPTLRADHSAWNKPLLRFRLILAAIQRTRQARSVLLHIDRHCLFPWAGGSARDFAVRAAQAFDDIELYGESELWPFDGPDPFLDS